MNLLDRIQKRVSVEIPRLLKESVESRPRMVQSFYEPLVRFLTQGGKRVRPLVVYLTGQALQSLAGMDEDDWKRIRKIATSVEMIHNFTLIHDDIMDESEVRRGMPAIHIQVGISRAILGGDALFALALALLEDPDMPAIVPGRLARRALEVCEGQERDLALETRFHRFVRENPSFFHDDAGISLEQYLQMVQWKTASLLEACVELPVLACRQSPVSPPWNFLQESARLSGIAFQIFDDYLDTFGTRITKTPLLDLKTVKLTAVPILALQHLPPSARKIFLEGLNALLQDTSAYTQADTIARELQQLLVHHGIDQQVLDLARSFTRQALEKLFQCHLPSDIQEGFATLWSKFTAREQ